MEGKKGESDEEEGGDGFEGRSEGGSGELKGERRGERGELRGKFWCGFEMEMRGFE